MLFSAGPVTSEEKKSIQIIGWSDCRLIYFLEVWRGDVGSWQLNTPPLPVWVRPVFSPLTNVICSNQPIKLGRAATQKLLHYSQVTATHLYPHCPLIGQNVGPTEPSLAGAGSFVSVLTRQTWPDLAWVIGWKLVHWHYGYNIITSQATPPYNHPGSTGYSLF